MRGGNHCRNNRPSRRSLLREFTGALRETAATMTNEEMFDAASSGTPITVIAAEAGVSRQRVSQILIKMGMPRSYGPRYPYKTIRDDDHVVRGLYQAGCCDSEIGRQIGVAGHAVRMWRIRNKLPRVRGGLMVEYGRRISELKSKGMSLSDAGRLIWGDQKNIAQKAYGCERAYKAALAQQGRAPAL